MLASVRVNGCGGSCPAAPKLITQQNFRLCLFGTVVWSFCSLPVALRCTHAQTHAHTHARAHARTRAHAHTRTPAHTHTRTHTHARAHTHAGARAHAHTHKHTRRRAHARTHTQTHAYASTRTHAHAHTRVRTHPPQTHANAQAAPVQPCATAVGSPKTALCVGGACSPTAAMCDRPAGILCVEALRNYPPPPLRPLGEPRSPLARTDLKFACSDSK